MRDTREGITGIDWTVAGKVRSVAKATGPSLSFAYGADGQRILKQVGDPDNGGYREHYIRDAQGNIMAVYKYTNSGTASTKVVERPVYGSSRVGSYALGQEVMGTWVTDYPFTQLLSDVHKRYELNDHLGNVNTVVSGRLLDGAGAGSPKQAEVLTAQGYEPFGALLPGRNWRQPIGTPPPVTAKGTLVITEFSNGPSGSCEYVEIYVTKCALYPDATEVDIRGWIIDDNAGNFNTSGLCGTGVAINSGHLRFADVPAWASVPVGSVIVLYNGNDNCYAFTAQEAGTGGQYFVDVNSTALIERTGSNGTPSTSNCGYCNNSYTTATWDPVSLGNTADAIQVRCPDCPESEAGFFHGVAYGSGFGGLVAGANDLGGAYVPGPGGGRSYELTGTGSPGDGAQWTRIAAPAGGTPPTTAGVVDASVAAGLESASLACCRSFEAPVLAQKQGYRFGFQGQEKDDEMHGATGTSYAYTFRMHDPRIGRFLSIDPLAAKYPFYSPYAFSGNRVIDMIELEGLEPFKKPAGERGTSWDPIHEGTAVGMQRKFEAGVPLAGGVRPFFDWGVGPNGPQKIFYQQRPVLRVETYKETEMQPRERVEEKLRTYAEGSGVYDSPDPANFAGFYAEQKSNITKLQLQYVGPGTAGETDPSGAYGEFMDYTKRVGMEFGEVELLAPVFTGDTHTGEGYSMKVTFTYEVKTTEMVPVEVEKTREIRDYGPMPATP